MVDCGVCSIKDQSKCQSLSLRKACLVRLVLSFNCKVSYNNLHVREDPQSRGILQLALPTRACMLQTSKCLPAVWA